MKKRILQSMNIVSAITIVLTVVMVLSVAYPLFNMRLKSEIQTEASLIAYSLNTVADKSDCLNDIKNKFNSKRISLISSDGKVIFDNNIPSFKLDNHNMRPEIMSAREFGTGEIERTSATLGSTLYYYAVRLDDNSILRVAGETSNIYKLFLNILFPLAIVILAIYFAASLISVKLTKKITAPINAHNPENGVYDGIYDELLPFVKKISAQNKEINAQMERLKHQKTRLDVIGDSMHEALVILNPDNEIIFINKSAANIFGAADVINKPFVFLTRDPELETLTLKALDGSNRSVEYSKDNVTYQVFCSPVYENNTITGAVFMMIDISEKANSERIRREFTANVSHELKTPLTSILGYSEIIENGIAKPKDAQAFAGKVSKEATRLLTLIEDIIKLSGLDEQPDVSEVEEVSLLEIATTVAEDLMPYAEKNKVSISVTGKNTTVHGNRAQLHELIYNLCDNAIKYNKPDGRVEIKTEPNSVSVTDTGIGISDEDTERIFERFYRVDKSHSKAVNGTGLGLSIVKHIALAHHADIQVDSTLGQGTAITVTFQP